MLIIVDCQLKVVRNAINDDTINEFSLCSERFSMVTLFKYKDINQYSNKDSRAMEVKLINDQMLARNKIHCNLSMFVCNVVHVL